MTDTESEIKSLHRKLDCDYINKITQGDALEMLKKLDDNSVDCCITSPPPTSVLEIMELLDGKVGI